MLYEAILEGRPLRHPLRRPRNDCTTAARLRARRSALWERLFRDFPKVFKYPPVPLATGTGLKLRELLGTEFKPAEIRAFLQAWTSGPRYLKARCSRRDAA